MLTRRRPGSCLIVKPAVAKLASCAIILCTMINLITFSKPPTYSRLVRLIPILLMGRSANCRFLAHTCGPTSTRLYYEVNLPYAVNLQLLDWQKWLAGIKDKLRKQYHEEIREQAAARVQQSLWTYELAIDGCDGS
jgi:hypothetical protein